MKENDMLSNAAYDTTMEGYYDQIQDLFCGDDSSSSLLFKHTLASPKRNHRPVGTAHHLRLRRRPAALLPYQHRGRSAHDQPTQRLALHSGSDVGIRYAWDLGRSWLPRRLCCSAGWIQARSSYASQRSDDYLLLEQWRSQLLRGGYSRGSAIDESTQRFTLRPGPDLGF